MNYDNIKLRNDELTFVDLLTTLFLDRKKKNPLYSLRAFANFLEIDNSRLSKILSHKRPATPLLIKRIGKKLKISEIEIQNFIQSYKDRKHSQIRGFLNKKTFLKLDKDSSPIISNWHYYAILELIKLKKFKPEIPWIAKQLNISKAQTQFYIEKLMNEKYLRIDNNGTWNDLLGDSTHVVNKNYTSKDRVESQKGWLEKSLNSLEKVSIQNRDHSSIIMASSLEKIELAKEMIKNFRRELCELLEDCPEKDVIFQLGISLVPVNELVVKM